MLFPIIIPRRYNKDGRWVGPMVNLRHPDLAITWAELHEPRGMVYVNFKRQSEIEAEARNLHQEAMSNLRETARESLFTHAKENDGGYSYVVAMHEDGLGTSRLLLTEEWEAQFPDGYLIGIPVRSCGFIVPKMGSAEELVEAEEIVGNCYKDGDTAMLPGLHEPSSFLMDDG